MAENRDRLWATGLVMAVSLAALDLAASDAAAADTANVAAGRAIFENQCALCHDNSPHMVNDIGPALFGVVGRRVGGVAGYTYSPALQTAYDHHERWSRRRLDRFLTQPALMHPGTDMPMNFADPATRKAIIAYLKTLRN